MTDLTEFIRARLDEDEQAATAAGHDRVAPTPWRGESWDDAVLDGDGLVDARGDGIAIVKGERVRDYMVRYDPARVLAEVDAKQQTLRLHAYVAGRECSTLDRTGDIDHCAWVMESEACTTLRLLALPFADHPDYREEWRP